MASRALIRFLGFPRYPLSSPFSPRFLSVDLLHEPSQTDPQRDATAVSERFVLEELSKLLPIDPKPPNPSFSGGKSAIESLSTSVGDRFLSPDEKLRGVFLQKLRGRSAVESALSAAGVDLTSEIFADVLNKGNLGGAAMVSFFDWAVAQPKMPNCVEMHNVILRALGRRKFFEFFDEILQRMKENEIEPNSKTLEILIDSFVAARQVSKAVQLFRSLEEIGAKRDTESFNILLECLCRRTHVGIANSLFNTVRENLVFNNRTYNELIGGWARIGRVDKAESCWTMMIDDGLKPDSVTFCRLIEALGRAGRNDEAVDVFEKMEESGCIRNTMIYNALISNFILVGDLEKSIEYYKDMSRNNCSPDINTYNKLIIAFLKVRRVADALETFDEMLGRGIIPSTGMATSFIEPLCSFGPPHAAMLMYKKSRKAGCRISLKAYKLLLMRLSRAGKSGMVLKIWEEMQEGGFASDTEVYEFIVNGLCNVGKVETAVLVVEEALRKGFSLGKVVYSKLNSKLLEMNKVETAYKLSLKIKDARNKANSRAFWRANGWHF
ncbi:putative pentatricopeptide repeat-containing protein At5g43820 [Ananas comosus]|uniref:Pentatricopeptide repeat-containing protein At5g43820 n=1 Tax=Ananas comosus TaxID=4615 RepID=A0A6P5ETC6_ANACO|nr:putative pentatricopeptide repeat-containing protein At5g43820 [Ananas comosus]